LKDKQLFQFRLHARMLWAAHTAVNYCRPLTQSAALVCDVRNSIQFYRRTFAVFGTALRGSILTKNSDA
jgi:hypothetical protein